MRHADAGPYQLWLLPGTPELYPAAQGSSGERGESKAVEQYGHPQKHLETCHYITLTGPQSDIGAPFTVAEPCFPLPLTTIQNHVSEGFKG